MNERAVMYSVGGSFPGKCFGTAYIEALGKTAYIDFSITKE